MFLFWLIPNRVTKKSRFLFPFALIFTFTDELLSFLINLQTLARWGSLNLNNHLKRGVTHMIFPGTNALDKYFYYVCPRPDPSGFYTSAVLIPANSLRLR